MSIKNILTFDVENFSTGILIRTKTSVEDEGELSDFSDIILELLYRCNIKATFFVVSVLAEKYAGIIKNIADAGHHIGTHSHNHQLIYDMTRHEFESDLKKSIDILENICNKKIDSFRAPAWSYCAERTHWFWDVLRENEIKYDSSIFPAKNFLFGDPLAPRVINERDFGITEIPPSTIRLLGKNFPFCGGFYFRIFPYFLIKKIISGLNLSGHPAVVYLHPYEIIKSNKKVKGIPLTTKLIAYYNVKNNLEKLEKLLKDFQFGSIRDYFESK